MNPGFYNQDLAVRTQDGRNSMALEPLFYLDYDGTWHCAPAGSWSDGISTPPPMWITDPPFGKERYFTGRLHDASPKYRCTLMTWAGDHWKVADMTFTECNALLKRALISQGTSPEKAEIYFAALEAFGTQAMVDDLSQAIGKIEVPPPPPTG